MNLQTSIIITFAKIKFAFLSMLISVLVVKIYVILNDKTQYFSTKIIRAITLNKSTMFIIMFEISANFIGSSFIRFVQKKLPYQIKQRT
jgi:hypothetical protein